MTITQINQILADNKIRILPSLSQNFFIDSQLLTSVINTIEIPKSNTIVEIGPGLGALTEILLTRQQPVIAFEIDTTLATILPTTLNHPDNLTVYHQDILKSQSIFDTLSSPYLVIANIPYHITNPIIRFLITQPNPATSINLLIQKEVALNLLSDTMSLAKISTQIYADIKLIRHIPKESFYPRPRVDSSFIQLTPHTRYSHLDREALIQFIKVFFQAKRKTLSSTAKKHFPRLKLPETIQPNQRPEELSIEDWIVFFEN